MYLFEDVRFGLRTLVNNLAFTTVAVIAIALGIGVNATVFTITNAVLVKSLPVEKSDRVLYIHDEEFLAQQPAIRRVLSGFSRLAGAGKIVHFDGRGRGAIADECCGFE